MKSGNFNFLEPSRPIQACNRTTLPYILANVINRHNRLKVHDFEQQPSQIDIHFIEKFTSLKFTARFVCKISVQRALLEIS